jgi:hypothetical protein
MHNPQDSHWMAIKRVLCYLKGTINYDLFYAPSAANLIVFYDCHVG